MNTLENIKTRRSTRKFKAQPVEIEKVEIDCRSRAVRPYGR